MIAAIAEHPTVCQLACSPAPMQPSPTSMLLPQFGPFCNFSPQCYLPCTIRTCLHMFHFTFCFFFSTGPRSRLSEQGLSATTTTTPGRRAGRFLTVTAECEWPDIFQVCETLTDATPANSALLSVEKSHFQKSSDDSCQEPGGSDSW